MRALTVCAVFLSVAWVCPSAEAEDQWGCQVLLCLSNPDGPEAVNECRPPIERLWYELHRGHPFPSCPSGGSAYARLASSYYDLCPVGTTELPSGQFAAAALAQRAVYSGIGDGGGAAQWMYSGVNGTRAQLPPKVCVGSRVGQGTVYVPSEGGDQRAGPNYQAHVVGYYDRLVLLPAHRSPNAIDVYIDNARYQRVRW